MKLDKVSVMTALALGALVVLTPMGRCQENKDKENTDQHKPAAGQRAPRAGQNQFQQIAEQLKLTEEQKTKLQPILKEEAAKRRELRQDTTLTTEQRREKNREIRAHSAAKVKPILSAEQFEQFKKMRQQAAGRGQPGGQRGQAAPGKKQEQQ